VITNDDIRREFLAAGFEIKPGHDDLKPYVYEAAQRVIALAVAAERERCVRIVEAYQVPVGNSAAGEMAAERTMDALREVRDAIRGA
jgi:hypothetical protein